MTGNSCIIGVLCTALAGCSASSGGNIGAAQNGNNNPQFTPADPSSPATRVLAYLDGRPISHNDLQAALYEAAGGQVLAELILDRRLDKRLAERGLKVTPADLEAEKAALLKTLDANNDDSAVRLLRELRRRRGLGDVRFDQLLRRNAAMRQLVQEEVKVSEIELKQAFEIEYGPRFEVRLITVDNLSLGSEIVRQARGSATVPAASFLDLAVRHSTDSSRTQGGLLAPVSPADPTWPDGVRKAVALMEEGKISDPIAIEKGFAILKLERKIPAKPISLEAVRADLTTRVKRNTERVLMQRLARTMLNEVELIVTDRTLRESWALQKESMFQE
jgi:parvulin-like peptidyl-prolyl isomerase